MNADTNDPTNEYGPLSRIRDAVGVHTLASVLLGVTAGYSLLLLGTDVVSLPVVGAVPGLLVGVVGLTATAIVFRKIGCCGSCGSRSVGLSTECGCSDECGDRCSYGP